MKEKIRQFYDNHTGLFLVVILAAGLLFGGLLAYDPALTPQNGPANVIPTPTRVPPTPVSINIPTQTPISDSTGSPPAPNEPADGFNPATPLPNGWVWRAPEKLVGRPQILSDGTAGFTGESGTFYFVNADGSPRTMVAYPFKDDAVIEKQDILEGRTFFLDDLTVVQVTGNRVFAVHPESGMRSEFEISLDSPGYFTNLFQSSDVWLIADAAFNIYAFTPVEGLLWTFPLDGVPNDEYFIAAVSDENVFYLADSRNLHAFGRDGLLWTFSPGENLHVSSDPQIGPDGNIYLVLSGGMSGILVSVTPEGEERWRTRLETHRFNISPSFSAGKDYVFIDKDFISLSDGQLRVIDFPFTVDNIFAGEDGFDYLITGLHIIRWRIGPDGFEQLKDITVNMEGFNNFFRPFLHIHPDGLIEFTVYSGRESQLVWIDTITDGIRVFPVPLTQFHFSTNRGEVEYLRCDPDIETGDISCARNIPGMDEPVWTLKIDGIYSPVSGHNFYINYLNGRLYMQPDPLSFYAFDLEIP